MAPRKLFYIVRALFKVVDVVHVYADPFKVFEELRLQSTKSAAVLAQEAEDFFL